MGIAWSIDVSYYHLTAERPLPLFRAFERRLSVIISPFDIETENKGLTKGKFSIIDMHDCVHALNDFEARVVWLPRRSRQDLGPCTILNLKYGNSVWTTRNHYMNIWRLPWQAWTLNQLHRFWSESKRREPERKTGTALWRWWSRLNHWQRHDNGH